MKEYDAKTKPLLNEFEKRGALINFETKKGVKDYPELKKIVEGKLSQVWWCLDQQSIVILPQFNIILIHILKLMLGKGA